MAYGRREPAQRELGDPGLPPNKAYRCTYVAAQVAVKAKYGLWVTSAEQDAMKRVLSTCPEQKLPTGGNPTKAPARFHAD